MAEKAHIDERVRVSFQRVKEDISTLNSNAEKQKEDIKNLKNDLETISRSLKEIKDTLSSLKKSSIGNNGVNNDHQRSSTINNNKQQSTTPPNAPQGSLNLSPTLTLALKSLSDREFSVFAAIFELEKQLPEVTYTDLANKLAISEPTIRNVVNCLISKKIPLQKTRFFNKKVSLSIPKEVKESDIIPKLIQLHHNPYHQRTLFET